jgi:peptide/nickel transport system substrate-binding protein
MIYTVPPQDTDRLARTSGIRIHQMAELRTIYLGMGQSRAELLKSDVRGRNPSQGPRVRQAVNHAIDRGAIVWTVIRGQARPTGLMVGPGVNGFVEAEDRVPAYDPDRARRLHAEGADHVPPHQQVVVRAARQNVSPQQLADNIFPLRFVRIGN